MSPSDPTLRPEHLQAAVAAAGLGTWEYHPPTPDWLWSAQGRHLLGIAPTASVDYAGFLERVHPDDRLAVDAAVQAALHPAGPGTLDLEFRTAPREGTAAPRQLRALGRAHFDDARTRAVRLVGTLADGDSAKEKALRRATAGEAEFTALVNTVAQLAWMAEADGHIFWYNERWYEYTGTTLEEMLGWGWQKVHHPDHVAHVLAFVRTAWLKSEPFELTFPLRRHDGEYRWFLTRAVPILDAQGRVQRWFGTNTDVTEMRQLQDQLARAYQDLEEKVAFRNLQLEREVQSLRAQLGLPGVGG